MKVANNKQTSQQSKEVKRYRQIVQNMQKFVSSLDVSNKHNFQAIHSDVNHDNGAVSTGNTNEATTNDTTMIKSAVNISNCDDLNMNRTDEANNSNAKVHVGQSMTDDLQHLEDKTINLFKITYNYVINGGSLNSLEKIIPTLLECGTIIIDTHNSQTALHDIFNELVLARKEIDFELIRMSFFCDEQSKHGTPLFNILAQIRDHVDDKLLVYVDSVNLRQTTEKKKICYIIKQQIGCMISHLSCLIPFYKNDGCLTFRMV